MAWKQRGEHARSSDESMQTVLGPAGSGPTELLCVPQVGGGVGHPLWHSSGTEWGPGHRAVLKAQVQQLLGLLANHAGVHFSGFKGLPHRSCWLGPPLIFLIISRAEWQGWEQALIGSDLIGTLGNRLSFLWTNWNVTLLGGSAVHTACQSPLMVVLGGLVGTNM